MSYATLIEETAGLVSFWKCNELSGTELKDSTSTNHLTLQAKATLGAEGIGDGETAVSFDGTGSTGAFRASPVQTVEGPFTLELWFNATTLTQPEKALFSSRNVEVSACFDTQYNTGGIHGDIGNNTSFLTTTANTTTGYKTSWGEWHYLAVVVTDEEHWKIYIDGAEHGSGTMTKGKAILWKESQKGIALGREGELAGFNKTFTGYVSKVAGYKVALSAAQISAHFSARPDRRVLSHTAGAVFDLGSRF